MSAITIPRVGLGAIEGVRIRYAESGSPAKPPVMTYGS
jgi:hypothetical protein